MGCFVYYIGPKGVEGPRPYFDSYLTTIEEICEELEMLCDKIEKRMNNPELARYPVMVLIDDFDSLVMYKKEFMDMLVRIAERGHLVGIHLVAASIPISWKVFPGLLKANIPARICFRVTDKSQSRLVLDSPDATQLSHQGEMFFSHNLQLTRLQTINVTDQTVE
jgi:S-DNA-T family DNA segregation ATPase FtsK/SpoIIIE